MMSGVIKIRPFESADAEGLVQIANSEKISRNLRDGFPFPYTFEHARKFIDKAISDSPSTIFAIEENGVHVGNIGLHPGSDIYFRTAELGYFIGEAYWGRGIASEAVRQITEWGFENLDLIRIYAGIFDYNHASMRVLEKNGFKKEGIARKSVVKRGKILDEHKYALINPRYDN